MGVMQHLDGISGTEKQEVAFDYAQRLSIGIDNAIVRKIFLEYLLINYIILECHQSSLFETLT
jgi:hypothetical protein